MADVLIRNVPERTLKALKRMAARSGRSLQQELLLALQRLGLPGEIDPVELAEQIRRRLARSGKEFSNSTSAIRADRRR